MPCRYVLLLFELIFIEIKETILFCIKILLYAHVYASSEVD
jgi:hypothetical protein